MRSAGVIWRRTAAVRCACEQRSRSVILGRVVSLMFVLHRIASVRDPLQAELFENPPKISAGWLTLNEAPGLGLTLSETAVRKFGERVL